MVTVSAVVSARTTTRNRRTEMMNEGSVRHLPFHAMR
jgi:hypothetical protein